LTITRWCEAEEYKAIDEKKVLLSVLRGIWGRKKKEFRENAEVTKGPAPRREAQSASGTMAATQRQKRQKNQSEMQNLQTATIEKTDFKQG
jgi:hypothetical protein